MNRFWAPLLVLAAAASPASAEDPKLVKVDNPEFASWSKHKPGTSTVTIMTNDASGGMKPTTTTITTKLVEVTADKCVVEMDMVSAELGKDFKVPAQRRDVPKSAEVPAATAKQVEAGKPEGTYEEGTETLKVAGTEYKTKWYKFKSKGPNAKEMDGQVWTADDVPGLTVKSSIKVDKLEVRMELTEFAKK